MTAAKALSEVLGLLKAANYHFVTITPATHARVLAREIEGPRDYRDIFGWSRSFKEGDLSPRLMDLLCVANAIERRDGRFRSKVRVASLGDDLFLHSAYPTNDADSVFFGPDTYRFARFLRDRLPRFGTAKFLVDMGAGSGAGAVVAAKLLHAEKITMVDVNSEALRLAAVNASVAGVAAETLASNSVPSGADLIIANPPYMKDSRERAYRDGGGMLGAKVALDWVGQGLSSLAPNGTILLYTGSPYLDGKAPLIDAILSICARAGASVHVDEIDPDVFGEELECPGYEGVERIAVFGLVIRLQATSGVRG